MNGQNELLLQGPPFFVETQGKETRGDVASSERTAQRQRKAIELNI